MWFESNKFREDLSFSIEIFKKLDLNFAFSKEIYLFCNSTQTNKKFQIC
jgi:hypothetical protein